MSKPTVSQECFSPKQNITCSSWGDAVEFNMTLDGQLLMQTGQSQSQRKRPANRQPTCNKTEEESSYSDLTISLPGQYTGHFKCVVRNNISRDETVIYLTGCKGTVLNDSSIFTKSNYFLKEKDSFWVL